MARKKADAQEPETTSETQEKDTMINIGGLWANVSKNGDLYYTGYLNGARLLILPNNFKSNENHPDYVMNVLPHKAKEADTDVKKALEEAKKKAQSKDNFGKKDEDEIPF